MQREQVNLPYNMRNDGVSGWRVGERARGIRRTIDDDARGWWGARERAPLTNISSFLRHIHLGRST